MIHHDDIHIRGATNDAHFPYRIQFSGVGPQLSLKVLNPTTGELIQEVTATDWTLTEGLAAFWTEGWANPGDSYTITVDNFLVTGNQAVTSKKGL